MTELSLSVRFCPDTISLKSLIDKDLCARYLDNDSTASDLILNLSSGLSKTRLLGRKNCSVTQVPCGGNSTKMTLIGSMTKSVR